MKPRSYLDHNASSPLRPQVVDAMVTALGWGGNASSVHAEGRRARAAIESARSRVAALVGAAPDRVIFTSGGTEANNLALRGFLGRRVLASAVEHVAVRDGADDVAGTIPVTRQGLVGIDGLTERLNEGAPALLAIQVANNETGVLQPIVEIATVAKAGGSVLHCDAVQAAGRVPLATADLGASSLALSAHKLGGPGGVGALVLAEGVELDACLLAGGGQEGGRRGGTENLAGIVGFGVAAELAARDLHGEASRLGQLRDDLEERLRLIAPDIAIFGADAPRLPNTSCFALPGLKAETALIALDLDGIAVSSGAACSSGKVGRSHVLAAMDVPDELARGALRVSLGWSSTADDVHLFATAFGKLVRRLYPERTARAAA